LGGKKKQPLGGDNQEAANFATRGKEKCPEGGGGFHITNGGGTNE